MSLSRQDLIDYATRYITPDQVTDFPIQDELFAFISRPVTATQDSDTSSSWAFGGYGLCLGYNLDTESKPEGKWVFMNYISLAVFPPEPQSLKLQPPHIVTGTFHSFDRTREIRIVKVQLRVEKNLKKSPAEKKTTQTGKKRAPKKKNTGVTEAKILEFRPKS